MIIFNTLKLHLKEIFNKKNVLQSILIPVIPSLIFYAVSLEVLKHQGFTVKEIIKEAPQITDTSSFLGFLSNIGVSLWISSATICFFTIIKSNPKITSVHKELLLLMGAFSALLAIDDFFMVHDRYIYQEICYFIYALLAIVILIRHYKIIINIDGFAFLLAASLLASSIFIDLIQSRIPFEKYFVQSIEEGFKFLGIATWLYFNYLAASYTESNIKV